MSCRYMLLFNHANRTIGSQDTAGDWVAWSVGSLARQLVSYVKLCMFIVPLFPALFANRLLADRTSHSRGSAPLLPILCTQFSSELLSVCVRTQISNASHRNSSHMECSGHRVTAATSFVQISSLIRNDHLIESGYQSNI